MRAVRGLSSRRAAPPRFLSAVVALLFVLSSSSCARRESAAPPPSYAAPLRSGADGSCRAWAHGRAVSSRAGDLVRAIVRRKEDVQRRALRPAGDDCGEPEAPVRDVGRSAEDRHGRRRPRQDQRPRTVGRLAEGDRSLVPSGANPRLRRARRGEGRGSGGRRAMKNAAPESNREAASREAVRGRVQTRF